MAVAPALAAGAGGGVGVGTIIGGIGTLGGLIGGKNAKRQGDKALDQQAEQAAWVRSLFNSRKQGIEAVGKWADEQGLLSPQAMWNKLDQSTAPGRARDTKNLANALFKFGGYKHGETVAENVLANAELAHANSRDQQYLSMALDSFNRRLTLATAPTETGLVGQAVQAGQAQSQAMLQKASMDQQGAYGALGNLGNAWSQWEAYNQTRKRAQETVQPTGGVGVTPTFGSLGNIGGGTSPIQGSLGSFG